MCAIIPTADFEEITLERLPDDATVPSGLKASLMTQEEQCSSNDAKQKQSTPWSLSS